jgi:6-phosphogluconolactonase (cycloisomerase 2 family)
MNDITDAGIWKQDVSDEDHKILINNDLPGPVRQTWMTIKDKEIYIMNQKKDTNVYTYQYQLRDTKLQIINYVNYTWQDLQNYNIPDDILDIFKNRLLKLSRLV